MPFARLLQPLLPVAFGFWVASPAIAEDRATQRYGIFEQILESSGSFDETVATLEDALLKPTGAGTAETLSKTKHRHTI